MTSGSVLSWLAIALSALGCKGRGGEGAPASASSASVESATSPVGATSTTNASAPPLSSASAALPPANLMNIEQRFATEAARRPTGTPRVEDVLAELGKTGAVLRDRAQHLGSPFQASYCVGAKAGRDVHLSVCEYTDERAAEAGRTMSETSFAAVANRTVTRNKATTLTLRLGENGSEDRALATKLVDAFQKVAPPGAR